MVVLLHSSCYEVGFYSVHSKVAMHHHVWSSQEASGSRSRCDTMRITIIALSLIHI